MHEIMQGGTIYMDALRRKRAATSPDETVLEIRLSDKPYPQYSTGQPEDEYRREVYEWMGASIEICLIEADQAWNVNMTQLWEPCAFACMLTVQGYEVMVGTNHRIGPNADILMGTTSQSLGVQPIHTSQQQVYIEFSKMLSASKVRHEEGKGSRPPIRQKTFREAHDEFIKQMGLDDL
jgi:hypothetical protein